MERNGRCVHVEAKRSRKEKPSPAQRARARELHRHGMTVLLCADLADVDRVISLVAAELLRGQRVASDPELVEFPPSVLEEVAP